ncbi:hypothetical protein SEA_NERGAL_77 [Mycobacterium Phage Nergal]|nr:hypothetical protein SEA_NERGAL_77 [Mycobacterium Phage Nergal]
MIHQFLSADENVSCLTCGAEYEGDGENAGHCSQRTDLVHGFDCSSHSLDDCAKFDQDGECEHLAILTGCDCLLCA